MAAGPNTVIFVFLELAKQFCPLELCRDFVEGDAVGSKSYLMVVKNHDAAAIWTLTSRVAANQRCRCFFVLFL